MSEAEKVAEKMEMTERSESIHMTDLGQSVLTLDEVVQTFELESAMYNIKLPEEQETEIGFRTVIMSKTNVEIDDQKKLIIMIRDVTDQVRLQ